MEAGPDAVIVVPDQESRVEIANTLGRVGIRTRAATTGRACMEMLEAAPPGLALIDADLPDASAHALCRTIKERFDGTLSVMLISERYSNAEDRIMALLLGADECLSKPFEPDELNVRALKLIRRHPPATRAIGDLTPRELQVIRLLANGCDQSEIADRLVISPRTVATHLERIIGKAGVHSRAQVVSWAFRTGLIESGST